MVLVEAESDFVQVSPLLCRVLTDGSGCEDEVCVLFLASYSLKCYSVGKGSICWAKLEVPTSISCLFALFVPGGGRLYGARGEFLLCPEQRMRRQFLLPLGIRCRNIRPG